MNGVVHVDINQNCLTDAVYRLVENAWMCGVIELLEMVSILEQKMVGNVSVVLVGLEVAVVV